MSDDAHEKTETEKWLDRLLMYFVAPMIVILAFLIVVLPIALQLLGIARFDQ